MRFLRTNTATRVTVGPFIDNLDGVTPETALTTTNCHLTLVVDNNGVPTLILDANATSSGGSNDLVHVTNDDAGFYDLELTNTQLNYLGRAMLSITDSSNHCPVFHEFMILPTNIYDSLVNGLDNLQADIVDKVWDEILTGATHNIANSAGRRLRQLGGALAGTVVDTTPSTTDFDTSLTAYASGFFNDQVIRFTSGILTDQAKTILNHTTGTGNLTFDEPWTSAPANGDAFEVTPLHVHPISQISDMIWEELLSTHTTAGTTGEKLGSLSSGGGSGSTQFEYLVQDNVTLLGIDGVFVRVTQDVEGNLTVVTGYTNSLGKVTFLLDPGDYYFWSSKAGYNFVNPDLETVV